MFIRTAKLWRICPSCVNLLLLSYKDTRQLIPMDVERALMQLQLQRNVCGMGPISRFCSIGPSCCFLFHSSDAEKGKSSSIQLEDNSDFFWTKINSGPIPLGFPNLDRPSNKSGPKLFCRGCLRFNKKLTLCRLNDNKFGIKWFLKVA